MGRKSDWCSPECMSTCSKLWRHPQLQQQIIKFEFPWARPRSIELTRWGENKEERVKEVIEFSPLFYRLPNEFFERICQALQYATNINKTNELTHRPIPRVYGIPQYESWITLALNHSCLSLRHKTISSPCLTIEP